MWGARTLGLKQARGIPCGICGGLSGTGTGCCWVWVFLSCYHWHFIVIFIIVHSFQQKSSSLKLSLSPKPEMMWLYSCHHNSSHSWFPYICVFMAFLCLPFSTVINNAYVLTKETNMLHNLKLKYELTFFNFPWLWLASSAAWVWYCEQCMSLLVLTSSQVH